MLMDMITIMIMLLPYSLPMVPFLMIFAIGVAWFGRKYETRGAFLAAGVFCILYSIMLATSGPMHLQWWKHVVAALLVVGISLAPIFVPILVTRHMKWMRGRLAAGLAGGIVSVFIFPYLAISVSCNFLGDCL